MGTGNESLIMRLQKRGDVIQPDYSSETRSLRHRHPIPSITLYLSPTEHSCGQLRTCFESRFLRSARVECPVSIPTLDLRPQVRTLCKLTNWNLSYEKRGVFEIDY
jgi:hypothetical protein